MQLNHSNKYIRTDVPLIWRVNIDFGPSPDMAFALLELVKTWFPDNDTFVTIMNNKDKNAYVCIRFKDEADESEFIMKQMMGLI